MVNPRLAELMYESELSSPSIDPALLSYQHVDRETLTERMRAAIPHCDPEELSIRVLILWPSIYVFTALRRQQLTYHFAAYDISGDEIARRATMLAVQAATTL